MLIMFYFKKEYQIDFLYIQTIQDYYTWDVEDFAPL